MTSVRKYETVSGDGSYTENVELVFGKEYESFRTRMVVDLETEQVLELDVEASGVRAFEGQAAAGEIVKAIRESLSERDIAISEAAFPVIRDIIAGALTGGVTLPAAALGGVGQ